MSTRRPVAVPGWDSEAAIVDDAHGVAYIERIPRRPDVRDGLEWECRLLPAIAPLLPLVVPVPHEIAADADGPWRVRHQIVPGAAATPSALTRSAGLVVGRFLRSLHDLDLGALSLEARTDNSLGATIARMETDVVPLLPATLREQGAGLIAEARRTTPLSLAHGDLGPVHLLVEAGVVSASSTGPTRVCGIRRSTWLGYSTARRSRSVRASASATDLVWTRSVGHSSGTVSGRGTRCSTVWTRENPATSTLVSLARSSAFRPVTRGCDLGARDDQGGSHPASRGLLHEQPVSCSTIRY